MSVAKYLQRYAEGDINLVNKLTDQWQEVICIPAYDENDALLPLLNSLSEEKNLLLILVLNSPASSINTEARLRTQKLGKLIKQQFPLQQTLSENCQLLQLNRKASHLLLLEHYSIPDKEGVGLARKIACDIACKLIHDKKINSNWIHNTDADVRLPPGYFLACKKLNKNSAAGIFAFKHLKDSNPLLKNAMQLYEYSLFYYVEALKWAGSRHAFHTIGSTLLLNHKAYALTRGFPKRVAGEDFYLLNKLRKIGKVESLTEPIITLSARPSNRVPFGTGPAINKISELNHPDEEYLFYHPRCFHLLKDWLTLLPHLWQCNELNNLVEDEILFNSLSLIGAVEAISHANNNSTSQSGFVKQMHNWFDAFRTLKLIHHVRNLELTSINLKDLQHYKNEYPFIGKANKAQELSESKLH